MVLKKFSEILVDKTSKYSVFLYRISSDIFAITSSNEENLNEIKEICKNITDNIVFAPILINNNSFYLSLTIGVARVCEDSIKNNLLSKAEYALRMARKQNISILFLDENIELYNKLKENKQLTESLKEALSNNNLLVFGQKIVNNKTKKVKYETLMRVKLSDNTILSPFKFLKEAKKAKLYLGMTRMLIKKSCEFFKDKDIDKSYSRRFKRFIYNGVYIKHYKKNEYSKADNF